MMSHAQSRPVGVPGNEKTHIEKQVHYNADLGVRQQHTITYCPNIKQPSVFQPMSLADALGLIKSDAYKRQIDHIRTLSGDYKAAKQALPCFHFNGTFKPGVKILNNSFKESSGLIHFDIDNLDQPGLEKVKLSLLIPSLAFCFISPGGNGLKGALRVDPSKITNDREFKHAWRQMAELFKSYSIPIDESCKDVRRACFASWDPGIYIDNEAPLFEVTPCPPETLTTAIQPVAYRQANAEEETALNRCLSILREAKQGERHQARLKAGMLAGGYIAGGILEKSNAIARLSEVSDSIANTGKTDPLEYHTILDGIERGKEEPITSLSVMPSINWSGEIPCNIGMIHCNTTAIFNFKNFSINEDIANMKKEAQAQVYILDGIALMGQVTTIYAKPNTGKTLLVLWLLIDAVKSGNITGENIHYVNADDDLNGVLTKAELLKKYNINTASPGYQGFDGKHLSLYLHAMVENGTARGQVIVLDTLKRFTELMDKKISSDFMKAVQTFIVHGGTMILLAHTNKNRGADGKVIAGGTSDISDDSSCVFTLDETNDDGQTKQVLFENTKMRGNVLKAVAYSYRSSGGVQWLDRFDSIKKIGDDALDEVKKAKTIKSQQTADAEIITAIESAIVQGFNCRDTIIDFVKTEYAESERKTLKVLRRYTGFRRADGHLWGYDFAEYNLKIYRLLPVYSDKPLL